MRSVACAMASSRKLRVFLIDCWLVLMALVMVLASVDRAFPSSMLLYRSASTS